MTCLLKTADILGTALKNTTSVRASGVQEFIYFYHFNTKLDKHWSKMFSNAILCRGSVLAIDYR